MWSACRTSCNATFVCRKKNLQYHEISAKSNYNYEKPFLYLARKLVGCAFNHTVSCPVMPAGSLGCMHPDTMHVTPFLRYQRCSAQDMLARMSLCMCALACTELMLGIHRCSGVGTEFWCALACRDPNLHFVEQVALKPPEVVIDQAQQQLYEQQLVDAANAPLPDEDDDIAE